jgi:glycosyltransferase involved in cell wall biosynthesis
MKEKFVSIIIPCRNEEETIEECIKSFLNQTYKNIEVIVVDDGSTDNSYQIARSFPVKVIRIEDRPYPYGPSHARNVGIKEARGDIIIFAEGDGKYAPNYVERAIEALDDPAVGGCLPGPRIPWTRMNNTVSRYQMLKWRAIHELIVSGKRPINGAFAFRREIFEKVGLYDETLTVGEDRDLVNRIKSAGYKLVYLNNVCWYHKEPDTLIKLVKRIWWEAVDGKRFRERWGLEPKGVKKAIRIIGSIATLLFPLYAILALSNVLWLIPLILVLFAGSALPIICDQELRLTFKLALKERNYKLATVIPLIRWVETNTRALEKLYTVLRNIKKRILRK